MKKSSLAASILLANAHREYVEQKARRVARNVAKGRCGGCLKKPWDCRCPQA